MKIVMMLLHDERFSGWSLDDKLSRFHFSKQYLEFCTSLGWESILYCFHESVKEKQVYTVDGLGTIKVFPVSFRFPPFLRFGNDHSPSAIQRELEYDEPDLIHFHNYYLFSFPYVVQFIKRRMKCPFTAQLHCYHQGWGRRLPYLLSLLHLRQVDRIFYSYAPEKAVYSRFGVLDRAVHVPMPSIDPKVFKSEEKRGGDDLLYVGRLPGRASSYAEKSPALILFTLQRMIRERDVKLTIVGDGVGLPYLRYLASELGIEKNVEFKGFTPREELPRLYQRASLTLVPLRLEDVDGFFDGSIQESLACGTPVAAFKSRESIPLRGTFGFLLPGDPIRSAREVSTLLSDSDELNDIGAKGSAFVHSNCTEDVLKKILRSEWEGLLKR